MSLEPLSTSPRLIPIICLSFVPLLLFTSIWMKFRIRMARKAPVSPPVLPYLLPYVGNTFSFLWYPPGCLEWALYE